MKRHHPFVITLILILSPIVLPNSLLNKRAIPTSESTDQGPDGPILVVASAANPFSKYYAEILRTEGLNAFTVTDISKLSAAALAAYDVVILGEMPLSATQVTMFSDWVTSGGNLIAMRPDKQLASLLGLTATSSTLSDTYLLVDNATGPGAGIVNQTIQFHGTADLYTLSGAAALATLYSNSTTATANPAVTWRSIGPNGGQAAAFTFDLARSIVYTRQGNPAWEMQNRIDYLPIMPVDQFFGAAPFDSQPDWVDLNKVAIPQADEQQRLLANLILQMNLDRKPLPRFWYFPRGKKAVVVMTGDDHGKGGTAGRFDTYLAMSPPGCSVVNWECTRSTSYIYPNTPLSDSQAAVYSAQGFEISLHVNTSGASLPGFLDYFYTNQLKALQTNFPSLPPPSTGRTHSTAWGDYATHPQVELDHGIRLDTNYVYWPGSWVHDQPGYFTGSGIPMRFATKDGTLIDVYQAATQMSDIANQSYPFTIDTLLDNALGPNGYYGAFTALVHTDKPHSLTSDAILASARARGVSIVSARQLLNWLDGRNNSTFNGLNWSQNQLSFRISKPSTTNDLEAMLPTQIPVGSLAMITMDGNSIRYTVERVKGVLYAFFPALNGSYIATYE